MSGDKDMTTEDFLIFILPMILIVGAATVGTAFALPPNTTDWNWGDINVNIPPPPEKGSKGEIGRQGFNDGMPYPPDYVLPNGSGWIDGKTNKFIKSDCNCELTDDNLEEDEEEQDEQQHLEESNEWYK